MLQINEARDIFFHPGRFSVIHMKHVNPRSVFLQNWCNNGRMRPVRRRPHLKGKVEANGDGKISRTGYNRFHGVYVTVICDK
ncbi:hypothetical protein AGABI2DRAFT_196007 [Agaricus bisporus var. bisporus H97]|uniref:hypothetical protein n=1 Tax=Agaricus bisporus var. bisporus (strain H97 / ATCC MYA-4626 / FGSC 10389) TaxID=936046 RepID=UPI00029F69AB|nr:hypothetical protein AGABI2DRAFT_196007 [Agaricus bisporus var. bisporus H97]EKV42308.1 hypothetical protein AGABI2DRAFT_196007 [Agaricus bisporus var. bisporus H97]